MMIQLNPPIPLRTSRGNGNAHFLIDYGVDYDLHWVIFLDDSGECWTLNNKEIRAVDNITFHRRPAERHIPGFALDLPRRKAPAQPGADAHVNGVNGVNGSSAPAVAGADGEALSQPSEINTNSST